MHDRFLRACRRQPVDRTPIWMMRQAGRYMDVYQTLRAKYTMLERVHTPELAAEITLQPIEAFDLDAAIIFSDILPILQGMGLELEFVQGTGPVLHNPVSSKADVEQMATPPASEVMSGTLEAIKLVRAELDGKTPLIGFAGAPFTLASYAIEGGGSKNYVKVKSFMYNDYAGWSLFMEKLLTVTIDYMLRQVEAGAQALQVFDSWAGILSPNDYARYVLSFNKRLIEALKTTDVPIIYFATNTNGMLELTATLDADVFGVDAGIHIDEAWERLGGPGKVAVQGNLDPMKLYAPWEVVKAGADDILKRIDGRPGHIFNLGHGIHKTTPVETVKRLCEYVHEASEAVTEA